MRVLSLAIVAVPLCLALGVVRAHTQTTPSSQEKPSSQSTTAPQSAPATQTKSSIWVTKPKPPVVPPPPPKLEHFDISQIDKTLDPCQDFYQYACSKWNAANPIPEDRQRIALLE
jgi:hypothetical protein